MTPQYAPFTHIRPARQSDVDAVYEFISDLEQTTPDSARFRTIFEQNLASPTVHYFIAEWAGVVVGFVSCHAQPLLHHTGTIGEIQELYVKPDHRNQGIGHLLVATLDALSVQEGFVNLEVTTSRTRTDTVRFYERNRFFNTHVKLVKPVQS